MTTSWIHRTFESSDLNDVAVICVSIILCLMTICKLIILSRTMASATACWLCHANEGTSLVSRSTRVPHLCCLAWFEISLCCVSTSQWVRDSLLRWADHITFLTSSISHVALKSYLCLLLASWLISLIVLDICTVCICCIQPHLSWPIIQIVCILSVKTSDGWIMIYASSWAAFAPLMIRLVCIRHFWTDESLFLLIEEVEWLINGFSLSWWLFSVIVLCKAYPLLMRWLWLMSAMTLDFEAVSTSLVKAIQLRVESRIVNPKSLFRSRLCGRLLV